MTHIITALSFALLGGCLYWLARNDLKEELFGIGLGSGFWKACIYVCGAILIWMHHQPYWQAGLALGLLIFVTSAPHNLLLSPPSTQKITKPRDIIQKGLFYLFAKSEGDPVGHPLYWTFSAIRYALPIMFVGAILQHPPLVIAGPVCSLLYYPWIHSERSKYWRAAGVGAVLTFALAV